MAVLILTYQNPYCSNDIKKNYRNTPAIPDDVSPVEPPRKDSATESEEEGGIGTGKTGRLFEMGKCQITPPKEESDILTEVKEVVTVYSLKRE